MHNPMEWDDHFNKIVILGQDFDMSPERFTLDNMFAMELHKYQDVAEQIVNHAIKVRVHKCFRLLVGILHTKSTYLL